MEPKAFYGRTGENSGGLVKRFRTLVLLSGNIFYRSLNTATMAYCVKSYLLIPAVITSPKLAKDHLKKNLVGIVCSFKLYINSILNNGNGNGNRCLYCSSSTYSVALSTLWQSCQVYIPYQSQTHMELCSCAVGEATSQLCQVTCLMGES